MMGKQDTQMQTLILYLDAMIPSNHLLKEIKDVLKTCGKSARLWCLSTGPPLYTHFFMPQIQGISIKRGGKLLEYDVCRQVLFTHFA